jgi:hypothetical protein
MKEHGHLEYPGTDGEILCLHVWKDIKISTVLRKWSVSVWCGVKSPSLVQGIEVNLPGPQKESNITLFEAQRL